MTKTILAMVTMLLLVACGGGNTSTDNRPKTEQIAPLFTYSLPIYDQEKTTYTYDENGSIATSTSILRYTPMFLVSNTMQQTTPWFTENNLTRTYTYDYDNNEVTIGPEGSYEGVTVCTFDNNGNYQECNNSISSVVFSYDQSNHLENITSIYQLTVTRIESLMTYNIDGQLIETINTYTDLNDNSDINNSDLIDFPLVDVNDVEGGIDLNVNINWDAVFLMSRIYVGVSRYTYYPNGYIASLVNENIDTGDVWTNTYDETKHARVLSTVGVLNDGTVMTNTYAYHTNNVLKTYTSRTDFVDQSWEECVYSYNEAFELIDTVCDDSTN
jgi:hypothetical protein